MNLIRGILKKSSNNVLPGDEPFSARGGAKFSGEILYAQKSLNANAEAPFSSFVPIALERLG